MSVARSRKPSPSSAPLLWRMRHGIGRVWFTLALGMIGLGVFVTIYGAATGDMGMVGIGLTLVVGGALLAVGFRPRK